MPPRQVIFAMAAAGWLAGCSTPEPQLRRSPGQLDVDRPTTPIQPEYPPPRNPEITRKEFPPNPPISQSTTPRSIDHLAGLIDDDAYYIFKATHALGKYDSGRLSRVSGLGRDWTINKIFISGYNQEYTTEVVFNIHLAPSLDVETITVTAQDLQPQATRPFVSANLFKRVAFTLVQQWLSKRRKLLALVVDALNKGMTVEDAVGVILVHLSRHDEPESL